MLWNLKGIYFSEQASMAFIIAKLITNLYLRGNYIKAVTELGSMNYVSLKQ